MKPTIQRETRGEHMTSYSLAPKSVLSTNHMNEPKETDSDLTDLTLANDDHNRLAHIVILIF